MQTLFGHDGGVTSAVVFADGPVVLTASNDRTSEIWTASDGECVQTLSGHDRFVLSAVFTADESSVLTTSYDGTARI